MVQLHPCLSEAFFIGGELESGRVHPVAGKNFLFLVNELLPFGRREHLVQPVHHLLRNNR
jgi:hypothetical protein